jgi:hypothetical protein
MVVTIALNTSALIGVLHEIVAVKVVICSGNNYKKDPLARVYLYALYQSVSVIVKLPRLEFRPNQRQAWPHPREPPMPHCHLRVTA